MRTEKGFTLIELIFAMAILVIIVAAAAPTFNSVMDNVRLDSSISKIRTALSFARAQSAEIQDEVVICASSNIETQANPSCTGETDWSVGYIVFWDENGNGQFDSGVADDDELYRVWEDGAAQGAQLDVTSTNAWNITAPTGLLTFNELGEINPFTSAEFELRMPNCGAGDLRTINVNRIGRVQVEVGDC